ncbi:Barstar [Jeotgalibaca dankookensis]|uniref:Barstar n=1 Tax=Jeotgalibaca dankookensis TaxID=708126 RepID=A0A1S6ILQ9_9LACT|nr:barstar family protein [Jeotgalibaca dankookensis]AQS52479.1 Barstar [Jeotgalibaca dankookensis]
MEKILLDGADFTSREILHTILQEKLHLPDYYGRNLDALWDLLTTDFSKKMIVVRNPQSIKDNLGGYGETLLGVFRELAIKNRNITFVYSYPFPLE